MKPDKPTGKQPTVSPRRKSKMRIACIYLPSFPLQVHVRRAPHLSGQAVAISGTASDGETRLVACSRAAYEAGVRPGLTAASARGLCPQLTVRVADVSLYQRAVRSLAESLMALSSNIDIGDDMDLVRRQNHSIYLRVPSGMRGESFGKRLLAVVSHQGLRGRVGIADDRFAAWAAAVTLRAEQSGANASESASAMSPFTQTCISVPRGGSAAFLAPLSLSLLPIDDDVQRLLRTAGMRTVGDFAALPAPTLTRRCNDDGDDVHAMARGDGPTDVGTFLPEDSIVEEIEFETHVASTQPLSFLLRPLCDRICERLDGRDRGATQLNLRFRHDDNAVTDLVVTPPPVPLSGRALLDLVRAELRQLRCSGGLPRPATAAEIAVVKECDLDANDDGVGSSSCVGDPQASFRLRLCPEAPGHRRTRRGKKRRRAQTAGTPKLPIAE